MTRGEIEKLAADWRQRWEKLQQDGLLDELQELNRCRTAVLANAMLAMNATAQVELVKRLTERAARP